ncbi:MAG: riboflavin biosynthesis protein RibF, partial [Gemmatimonadetes bacterium]|nr:riboflavin biosynthesis protein RibF [Gemmatimonadota bacterium]
GVFDGVHRGHQAVLAQLRAVAPAGRALAVTLDPHPLAVLRPEFAPPLLTTAEERVRLLREIGPSPDAVIVRAFDRATAASAPKEFLAGLLPPGATLASLVIGYDFRMGKDRTGGYEELCAIGAREGFEVLRVPPTLDGDAPISSSRIRERIEAGDVAEAGRLLGHPYLVVGRVVPGRGVGRTLDFPTANVDVGKNGKLLPALGVYAVRVRILPDPERLPAVVNWGVRPTFGAGEPVLEVHIPGFRGDLTGRELALDVVDRIREERAFPDRQALVERIRRDVAEALERLQDAGEAPGKALPGSGRSDRLPG